MRSLRGRGRARALTNRGISRTTSLLLLCLTLCVVVLISEENVCKVIGQMVQNRHVPKMIVLTENSIVMNVYVSKHFAVMNWQQEFPVGLSMKMCAHVMQNTMILKKCKQQANFLQTQTSGGTVYFLY